MFVFGVMCKMAIELGVDMFAFDNNYLSSVTQTFEWDEDEDNPLFNEMSIPMLEILDGSMEKTVEYTRDIRRYIYLWG